MTTPQGSLVILAKLALKEAVAAGPDDGGAEDERGGEADEAKRGHAGISSRARFSNRCRQQLFQRLDAVGLRRRLVPADAADAGEAHGEAGFVPGRALQALEGDLEDEAALAARA